MHTLRSWRTGIILVGLILVLSLTALTTGWLRTPSEAAPAAQHKLSLSRPAFLQSARAAGDFDIGAYLDQEAGISAWLYTTVPINLTNAASAFRIIEDQTAEYIIGSVDLPNYTEHYDAHVYIHTDGYILTYYLRTDPASKIISIRETNISTTNLDAIIGIVAGAAGVPTTGVNYYDFRYPNAENILLVYENLSDGNDFTINMPGTFAYYERGFSWYNTTCCDVYFRVDGNTITSTFYANESGYGIISAAQLTSDTVHTITVDDHGVLMIIYTEP